MGEGAIGELERARELAAAIGDGGSVEVQQAREARPADGGRVALEEGLGVVESAERHQVHGLVVRLRGAPADAAPDGQPSDDPGDEGQRDRELTARERLETRPDREDAGQRADGEARAASRVRRELEVVALRRHAHQARRSGRALISTTRRSPVRS